MQCHLENWFGVEMGLSKRVVRNRLKERWQRPGWTESLRDVSWGPVLLFLLMIFAQKVGLLMPKLWGIVKGRKSLKHNARFKFWSARNETKQTSTAIQKEINLTKAINFAGNNKKSLHQLGPRDEKQQEEKNLGGISWSGTTLGYQHCMRHVKLIREDISYRYTDMLVPS